MSEHPRVVVRVTTHPGKPTLRELMVDGQKVYEFPTKGQFVDFVMQAQSTLRYD